MREWVITLLIFNFSILEGLDSGLLRMHNMHKPEGIYFHTSRSFLLVPFMKIAVQ